MILPLPAVVRRPVARLRRVFLLAFLAVVVVTITVPLPSGLDLVLAATTFGLAMVAAPSSERSPVVVAAPVRGRWVGINGPGTKVPSHGIRAYGQTYAVDVLHPSPPDAPARLGWSPRTRPAASYPTFGEPVLAVADGTVVAVVERRRDHRGRDTWPTLLWMVVVEAFFREVGGASRILGNHVVVDHGDGVHSAYAHLRRGSARVAVGDRVRCGEVVGEVGNSGNTTEPHLHFQLMDAPYVTGAAGIPYRWRGVVEQEETDHTRVTGDRSDSALDGVPEDGRVFVAG
jgi:hypothetical protein